MNYKIVADSAANLFELENAPFAYVPLSVHCEGKEFIDTPQADLEGMLQILRTTKEKSSTSCPNMQDWLDAFGDAEELYAIAITGALSGSYSAAMQAKEEYLQAHPNAKVHVINTLSAGPEMALLAEKIAALKASDCTFDETVAAITAYTAKTKLAFCLKSINNFARNGRVSVAKAKLVGTLGIRIVGRASEEGTLQQEHLCRGEAKSLQAVLTEMKTNGFKGGKVRIHHCQNPKAVELLQELLLQFAPQSEIIIRPCGILCSYYAEEGGILIGYET